MKRYLRLAAWCLGLALAVTACGRAGRIVLPEAAEVTAIRVTAGDAVTLHTDRDWIGEFLQQAAEAVSTGMESVQDAPDQTGAVKVELGTGETPDWSVLYVYEADGICALNFVMEQALGGGVLRSLAMDKHGKSLSSALLEMEL